MRSPPLSPSQRAYLFQQDKFLAGIQERAARLFEDGYTVEPHCQPGRFIVTAPNGKRPYLVDALSRTCTCCFYRRQCEGEPLTHDGTLVACKHLHGLKALIRAERLRLQEQQRWCCYYRLWAHWIGTLYAQYVEQQRRYEEARKNTPSPACLCRRCAAQDCCDDTATTVRTKGERP